MRLANVHLALTAAVLGAALGNIAARIWPAGNGAVHSCSAPAGHGLDPNACRYPPNQHAHLVHLSLFGMVAALVIVVIVELCRYEQDLTAGQIVG
jgi:hypothetical protein